MRILIIDDNASDAELAQLALKSIAGLEFDYVEDFATFKQKFSPNKYGAILSDYNLSGASGTDILHYVRELEPDIPLIIISGALGEELAVEVLRQGATDYVLKNKLDKLPLALSRALKEVETKKAKEIALQKLKSNEEKYRSVVEDQTEYIVRWKSDGRIVFANNRFLAFHETTFHELSKKDYYSLVIDKNRFNKKIKSLSQTNPVQTDAHQSYHPRHENSWQEWTDRAIFDENGNIVEYQSVGRDITESRTREEVIRESELRLRTAQRIAKIGNWEHDIETGKLSWSAEMYSIYDCDPETFTPTIDSFISFIHHNDREAMINFMGAVHSGIERSPFLDFRVDTADGGIKYIRGHAEIIFNEAGKPVKAHGTAQDITERRMAEETLQKSEEKFRKIFESIADVYYQTDMDGIYTMLSPSCFLVTGYYSTELIGKPAEILYENPEIRKMLLAILSKEKKINNHEVTIKGKNGNSILLSANINLLFDQTGKPSGTQGTYRDITEKKKKDEELFLAEAANRTKSQFLANMSHEIRTPLNAIIGLSHLVLKTDLTSKQLDYLSKIESSGESLLGIINDILDFSKIESGKLTMEEIDFDLEEVFGKMSDIITYKAQQKGIEIIFGVDVNTPVNLIGDPTRLGQILNNLATNAIKFTNKGETVILVKPLEDSEGRIKLQFSVRDTGIGIKKEQIERLFIPFTQVEDSITRKHGGTGLGLSIVKQLVEMMGGEVWVESEPGQGSCFSFTVWMKKQKHQGNKFSPSIDLRKLRVLLVDDNQSARKILTETLESFTFEVMTAVSGRQAIDILRNSQSNPVKVVLMDSEMDEMDGIETVQLIRQDAQFAEMPIIMTCAGYASQEVVLKAEDLRLSGILVKPIRHSVLFDTIMGVYDKGAKSKKKKKQLRSVKGLHRYTLLLVEDNEINQQVASELLEGFGFRVEVAANGLEAINRVKGSGTPSKYDLVLMDLQMPAMGGYEASQEIRKMEEYRTLPTIAMTADAMGGVKERCLEAGMVDFITKPVNPEKLLEVVRKWLKPTKIMALPKAQSKKAKTNDIIIPELEGIDRGDGLSHVGGNTRLYYDLLIKFMNTHVHFIAQVKKEFSSGAGEKGRRLIHTLKGLSGSLGMITLHETCKKAEDGLQDAPAGKFNEIIKPLSDELELVLGSLRKNLIKESARSTVMPISRVKPLLSKLQELLNDQDPEAVNVLKKIGIVKGYKKQMNQLEKAIKAYDFDAAIEILTKIELRIKEQHI